MKIVNDNIDLHRTVRIIAWAFAGIVMIFNSSCVSNRYKVFQFDNGDDYFCEGLHRIEDGKGKIGFSDENGNVVIKPRFAFASPFENGFSRTTFKGEKVYKGEHWFWESPEWFYIDHQGNTVDIHSLLEGKLNAFVKGKDARIGIAVIIDGTDTVSVNGRKDFPMMSVFKFPLALAVAEWIDSKGISLSDSVGIGIEQLHEDTYCPMLKKYGRKEMSLSYRELLEWTLIESDNNTTDILLNRIGGIEGINELLRQMGIQEGMEIGASEDDMHRDRYLCYLNRATPIAMAELFDKFNSTIRFKSATFQEVAVMLEKCKTGEKRLPAPLMSTNAEIGHKTGTGFITEEGRLTSLNDCGYVNLPDKHRYSIAVFIADSAYDMAKTERMIAEISQIVYHSLKDCQTNSKES